MGKTGESTERYVGEEMKPQKLISVLSLPLAIWNEIVAHKKGGRIVTGSSITHIMLEVFKLTTRSYDQC